MIVGIGGKLLVSDGLTAISSEKHAPRGLTTVVRLLLVFPPLSQAEEEETQEPERRTRLLLFEHERQLDDPGPVQVPQVPSQVLQALALVSQYSFLEHDGMQRPLLRTGRLGGQVLHWLKEEPEQVAQSGWQERQEPVEGLANVFLGQEEAATHWPLEESWLEDEQVRQKLAAPAQVLQLESHAK